MNSGNIYIRYRLTISKKYADYYMTVFDLSNMHKSHLWNVDFIWKTKQKKRKEKRKREKKEKDT